MKGNNILTQLFLPAESVRLGRFVVNPEEPHQDYLDPTCDYDAEVIQRSLAEYVALEGRAKDRDLGVQLGSLASSSTSRVSFGIRGTKTRQSTIYQLSNSRKWFKASLQHEADRKWLEDVVESGEDVYIIVGYQVMQDTQTASHTGERNSNSNAVQLPVVEVASAAAGAVIPVSGDLVNPGGNVSYGSEDHFKTSFVAPGTQVSAVQYRRVRFKWYSSRDIDRATLQKGSRWLVHGQLRGHETGSNDVMEASISDSEEEEKRGGEGVEAG